MQCFIVALAEHTAKVAMLAGIVQREGFSVETVSDFDTLKLNPGFVKAARSIVLVADPASDLALVEAAVQFAEKESSHAYLIYVSDLIEPETYKRLLRTQAGDWSKWDLLQNEIPEIVKRFSGPELIGSSAKIISFFPSKGGVGNTTLTIEVAVSIASARNHKNAKIALLDLNFEGGTLADSLDIEARFDIHEIASHPERLDNQLIDVFTSRYSDRFDVFATPLQNASSNEIAPPTVFAVLDLLASRYDVILIDIPNQHLKWSDNLLQGSDAVVVSGTSTVPALKQLGAKLARLDVLKISPEKTAIVVNQCEKTILGQIVRHKEISRALPDRNLFFVRDDVAAVRAAGNVGRSLMELSGGSSVGKDIRKLAEWIAAVTGIPPKSGKHA